MAETDSLAPPKGLGLAAPMVDGAAAPGTALVATRTRWLAVGAALEVGLLVAVETLLLFTHSAGSVSAFAWPLGLGATAGLLLILAMLRAEESRLARELRTARTGTAVLRALVTRRRVEVPFFARWSSSKLGAAAVLLADGDRDGALDAMRTASVVMRAGRLEKLREIVEADLERNTGTSAGLDRCVQRLRAAGPVGNREADLYRVHVLVKAVLEQGDAEAAFEITGELVASTDDDDARVYATWLRVWFDLDQNSSEPGDAEAGPWPELSDGDLRMATLAARAHGAESLVSKLALRLSAIARAESRG